MSKYRIFLHPRYVTKYTLKHIYVFNLRIIMRLIVLISACLAIVGCATSPTETSGQVTQYDSLDKTKYNNKCTFSGKDYQVCKSELHDQNDDFDNIVYLYNRAIDLLNGEQSQKSDQKAFEFLTVAAEWNYLPAQQDLGIMYLTGRGVNRDFKKAFLLFENAANNGLSESQFNLGLMYQRGDGVKVNYQKSFSWFLKSANQNNKNAQYELALIYLNGGIVPQDGKKGFNWMLRSAENGNSAAQFNTAILYGRGAGVETSLDKYSYWLQKAAQSGNIRAKSMLSR